MKSLLVRSQIVGGITILLIGTFLVACGGLPKEVENTFRNNVMYNASRSEACAGPTIECKDEKITKVVSGSLSSAQQANGMEAAWCVEWAGMSRYTGDNINFQKGWRSFRYSTLIVKSDGQYQYSSSSIDLTCDEKIRELNSWGFMNSKVYI